MVRLSDGVPDPLSVARDLTAQGLQVFPARFKDKIPLVKWKDFQSQPVGPMIERWFKDRNNINFWVLTGKQSGYVVIDCDSAEGEAWWRSRIGDAMDKTAKVKTRKGYHYWFKLPEGKSLKSWSVHPNTHDTKVSFDVRADDTGVIVPPSIHESGFRYEWVTPLDEAVEAPPGVLDESYRRDAPQATGDASGVTTGTGGQTRSMLSRLLTQPPSGEGSGRNDWLARVAGHYAKTYHDHEDLYEAHCLAANKMMGLPLDEAEFTKTVGSIWRGEHERNSHRAIDASCGFLASGETVMHCQVRVKDGDDWAYTFEEYADFDIRAKGVMIDDGGRRTYWCEVVRRSRTDSARVERIDIVLRAEVLGDDRAFKKFLASYACTILPPDNAWPKSGSPALRVQRYLESQQPPVVEITPALGFHPNAISEGRGGYITHEGAITATGIVGIDGVSVRADPRLRTGGTAPHDYGFVENEVLARQTLGEVLTFHDEVTASVFGAWWAACLLKPQIEERTSLFPFMAIEAPSESGKTNGYFSMMTQMNGNTRGETQPTKAALRDMAAAHRNGIVWVDDLDDPAYLMELLRAATSGGSLTKMGEDRESVKNTQIVAPVVISGEALGLGTQKALVDRAIILKAPSPTARRSLHNPSRPQWDDILAVREQHPEGLHDIAGWFVQDALSVVDETLAALREGRTGGSGRASDKVAVLRAGARLLDYLVRQDGAWAGRGMHARRVESWLAGNLVDSEGLAVTSNENALTLEVLPWAIRQWNYASKPVAGGVGELDTPVFLKKFEQRGTEMLFGDDTELYFRPDLLAEAWEDYKKGRQEKRTTTAAALKDQAEALKARSKQVRIGTVGRASYRMITGEVVQAVIKRSLGG